MKNFVLVGFNTLAALSIGFSSAVLAQDLDLQDEESRIAYSIGANIGQNLISQQLLTEIDFDMFVAGMRDQVNGTSQLSPDEVKVAIQTFQERMTARRNEEVAAARDEGEQFLATNAENEGVVELDSGLQYMILESGDASGPSPEVTDAVLAHYHGTFTDGSVFDSSVDRGEPAQFGVSQVIAGWTEALQLMKAGDKWRLFIPYSLAYGEAGSPPTIPPFATLIFDVEILEIR
ncbi:MAG: FKBP-type peptidyl-prolyl cis-trans isomerase [Gammaproteobacteria bacterium]|nr:FKBP-type peptidyl-prolyl cis-trans isomerase [Gammaproteobacteria bacterium]